MNLGLLFAMIAPLIIAGVALYGVGRGVDVYDALIHGGGEGLEVLLRIVPSLIALMTAVYMLRASGALELLTNLLSPLLGLLGIPPETALSSIACKLVPPPETSTAVFTPPLI